MADEREEEFWKKVLGGKHRLFMSRLKKPFGNSSPRTPKRPKGEGGATLPVEPAPKPKPLVGGAEAPIE